MDNITHPVSKFVIYRIPIRIEQLQLEDQANFNNKMFQFSHQQFVQQPQQVISTIRVKAKFGDQIRRFSVTSDISLQQFIQQLGNVFHENFDLKRYTLKYKDEEGDLVTIETTEEWAEAIQLVPQLTLLRVVIESKSFHLNDQYLLFCTEIKTSNTADVIVNEVQKFVGQVINESGKVVNKENCQKILDSVTSKFKDKESQQKFCETLKKVGSTIQSVVNEVVGEVEKEVSKALPVVKKVAEDVSQKVKEEIKAVREDHALGKIINEVSKSIENEMKKDEDWTFVEQSKSEPVKIDIEVENQQTQSISEEKKVEEKKVEEKKEQPKEQLKPVTHEVLGAMFIKDITVEDNSEIECGTEFNKIWRIRNSGNVKWPEGVCLEYLGGNEEMGMF